MPASSKKGRKTDLVKEFDALDLMLSQTLADMRIDHDIDKWQTSVQRSTGFGIEFESRPHFLL